MKTHIKRNLFIVFILSMTITTTLLGSHIFANENTLAKSNLDPRIGPTFREFLNRLGGSIEFNEKLFSREFLGSESQSPMTAFPFGRSLERHVANQDYPRTMLFYSIKNENEEHDLALELEKENRVEISQLMPLTDEKRVHNNLKAGYVIIAYTPINKQLQIISANNYGRGNGGFNDFIVVDDFAPNMNPKIVYPQGGLCMACHQNSQLIFPKAPWNERVDNFKKYQNSDNALQRTFSERIPDAYSFDLKLRSENQVLAIKQLIHQACPNDVKCRGEIVKLGLELKKDYSKLKQFFKTPNNAKSLHIANDELTERITSNFNIQEKLIFPFAADEDPLFPRQNIANFFTLNIKENPDEVLANLKNYAIIKDAPAMQLEKDRANEIVDQLTESDYFQSHWPLKLSDFQKFYNATQKIPEISDERSQIVTNNTERNKPKLDSRTVFYQRCYSCHYQNGGPAPELDFNMLKNYKGKANSSRTAKKLIELNIMPPISEGELSKEEKEVLLDYLR